MKWGLGLFPDCVGGSWEARPVWGAPKKVAVPPSVAFTNSFTFAMYQNLGSSVSVRKKEER